MRVIGATLTSIVGTTSPPHTPPEVEQKRQAVNAFIRDNKGLFDGVIDFDRATLDAGRGVDAAGIRPRQHGRRPRRRPASEPCRLPGHGDAVDLRLLTGPRRAARPADRGPGAWPAPAATPAPDRRG